MFSYCSVIDNLILKFNAIKIPLQIHWSVNIVQK